ncbi:MAG: AtpZ/AtpI family protein [Paracoccaceae bacterium]
MNDPRASQSDLDRLKELEQKIKAAKGDDAQSDPQAKDYRGAELGWRMVTEMVTGILLGGGIGYAIDYYAGTSPLGLIVFIFLGFAAGIKTMLNTAKAHQETRSESSDPLK